MNPFTGLILWAEGTFKENNYIKIIFTYIAEERRKSKQN